MLTAVSLVRVQLGELFYARKGRESSGRNEIDETCKIQENVSCRFFVTRIRALSGFCADANFDSMLHSVAVARYAALIRIKSPTN